MRYVALTSPEMRGRDILHLQGVLNDRLAHYKSRDRIRVDGIFGRASAHALASVGWIMGLESPYGRPAALGRILHPHLRNPAEIRRGLERERDRAHHQVPGVHGLDAIVAIAHRYVGVAEHPSGSNWGFPYPAKWEQEFGFNGGVSWCGCFAGAMVRLAGGHVGSRVAFCPSIEADARSRTNGFDLWRPNHNEGVGPGWLVLYNWSGGSEAEHVGIVKAIHGGYVETIEGNTGGSNPSDGGMVAIERRPYHFTLGYARPRI